MIGILPTADPGDANPHVTHVVATGVGQARNLAVVASGDAVIAVGGAWGALSEIAFARSLGRAVIGLRTWSCGAPPRRAGSGRDGPAGGGCAAALERAHRPVPSELRLAPD